MELVLTKCLLRIDIDDEDELRVLQSRPGSGVNGSGRNDSNVDSYLSRAHSRRNQRNGVNNAHGGFSAANYSRPSSVGDHYDEDFHSNPLSRNPTRDKLPQHRQQQQPEQYQHSASYHSLHNYDDHDNGLLEEQFNIGKDFAVQGTIFLIAFHSHSPRTVVLFILS